MSCVPYMWQYCWKEISAVANIFYLVHCLLRHEITLHVLCRDTYSTSMQQYCHPGNNSYKHEPYSLGLYAHHRRQAQSMLNNVLLLLRTNLLLFHYTYHMCPFSLAEEKPEYRVSSGLTCSTLDFIPQGLKI